MDGDTVLQYLAIVFALPGLLALVFIPYQATAALAVVTGVVLYGAVKVINAPEWTVLEYHKLLDIKRPDGSLATLTKRTKLRPNHKGQTEFIHRNLRADGRFVNFRLANTPVDDNELRQEMGEYVIHERFGRALQAWEKIDSELSYDLVECFMKNCETSGYSPDYFTKMARFEIRLPDGRPARNPVATVRTGAKVRPVNPPELSPDGRRITWELKNLRPGRTYIISWDW